MKSKRPPGVFRRFLRRRSALLGAVFLMLVFLLAIFGPYIWAVNPWDMMGMPLTRPGEDAAFPLGTDLLGRDILSGMLYGAQVSLLVGFTAALVSIILGTAVGAVGGFYRGKVDAVLVRITELFQTIPAFLQTIVVVVVFNPTMTTIIISIALSSWPPVARLVRGEVLSLRERDFVYAARTVGMEDGRIILTQILPAAIPPVIVMSSFMIATAILTEAGLSFLGLSDPNMMTWGTIIGGGRDALSQASYLTIIPGVAIMLTVISLNLVGEGLNDALNPRLRDR